MSEDDRAAKAARAKAMLNRRRQQKAGAPQASPDPTSQMPSRTQSPAPVEQPDSNKVRDAAELFSKGDVDTSWTSSLPRPTSPPARVTQTARRQSIIQTVNGQDNPSHGQNDTVKLGSVTSPANLRDVDLKLRETEAALEAERSQFQQFKAQYEQELHKLKLSLDNERQTVTLLVSEKSSLAAELHRLGNVESRCRESESTLIEERRKSSALESQMTSLQSSYENVSEQQRHLETRERGLNERCRDQERQLQLANGSVTELRNQLDDSQRHVRELEEQIQSDDRVERLEDSLKNTQDRADELEFQLSKLRQSQTTLKSECEELERQCHTLQEKESDLEQRNATLHEDHTRTMQELAEVTSERDSLVSEKFSLQHQIGKQEHSTQELRRMLDQASSELAVQTRQLQTLQGDLRIAIRRADEAEKMQKDLQLEGTNLMHSLDEMRPKIVELTSEKLVLTEKAESLQRVLRERESSIGELTSSLDDARNEIDKTNDRWQQKMSRYEREHSQTVAASSKMETAQAELQDQLDDALQSLHNLESQRASQRQEFVRNSSEIQSLNATITSQKDELSALKRELENQSISEDQLRDVLDQARQENETLRYELGQFHSNEGATQDSRSLNDEFVATLRQQHALDLSSAQSQIRALEDSVFDAEAKAHTFQKQIVFLEEQLRHARSASHVNRSFSPVPSRPASRNETDLRRSSFGSHRNAAASPLSRTVLEQDLSPETLHKRTISLKMLKARMESEMAPPSRALSPVHSLSGSSRPASPNVGHRPQFLDDSHVFWCSSCRGDLVIL